MPALSKPRMMDVRSCFLGFLIVLLVTTAGASAAGAQEVPVGGYSSASSSQVATASWTRRKGGRTSRWLVVATRTTYGLVGSFIPPTPGMQTQISVSRLTCFDAAQKACRGRGNARSLDTSSFVFDPLLRNALVTVGGRTIEWKATAGYEPSPQRRLWTKHDPLWAEAQASGSVSLLRRADAQGRILGTSIPNRGVRAAIYTLSGSNASAGICLIDQGALC